MCAADNENQIMKDMTRLVYVAWYMDLQLPVNEGL